MLVEAIPTDRSRIEVYQHCPKQRWLGYEAGGRGVERKAVSVPLLTGGLIHDPLAQILSFARDYKERPPYDVILDVVNKAQMHYIRTTVERGLLLDAFDGSEADLGKVLTDPEAWQVNEQLAMIEALVKGWTRVGLPLLLEEYDIIVTEKELQVPLHPEVVLLARPDAILRRKASGEYFVLNFKSTSNPDKTWLEQWRYDAQMMAEFVAAEHALGLGEVRGVIVAGLVKGSRSIEWPVEGQRRHNSPLLYHFEQPASPPLPASYKATAFYRCTEPHSHRWTKGGVCPGGKKHGIGDAYQRNMVVQTCGFDAWLDWLEINEPELLKAQFLMLPPLMRSEFEIREWLESVVEQEREVRDRAKTAREAPEMLNKLFPKHTHAGNCLRPSRCPFIGACWGVEDIGDPALYTPRRANHPPEAEMRGWVPVTSLKTVADLDGEISV